MLNKVMPRFVGYGMLRHASADALTKRTWLSEILERSRRTGATANELISRASSQHEIWSQICNCTMRCAEDARLPDAPSRRLSNKVPRSAIAAAATPPSRRTRTRTRTPATTSDRNTLPTTAPAFCQKRTKSQQPKMFPSQTRTLWPRTSRAHPGNVPDAARTCRTCPERVPDTSWTHPEHVHP